MARPTGRGRDRSPLLEVFTVRPSLSLSQGSRTRRLLAAATVGAAILALTGCGAAPEETAAPTDSATGDDAAASDFTACMVSDAGGFDDRSFNQLAHEGLVTAERELDISILESESQTPDDYQPNLEAMVQQGCNLIIPVGFNLADATQAAADANPDVHFAIVDVDTLTGDNILQLNYDVAQAAFLGGYAAAAYSKTGIVGTYGGMNIPTVTIFMDGFAKGVEHYNEVKGEDVQVVGWDVAAQTGQFVDNFTDQLRAQQITEGLLSQNADVILPVGGPLYQGGAEAIRASGKEAVILGVDSDLAQADENYADLVLVSIMKGLDVTVYDAIESAVNGEFESGYFTGTLENDGVGLSGFGDYESQLPEGLTDEIEQLRQDIIAGDYPDISAASPEQQQ